MFNDHYKHEVHQLERMNKALKDKNKYQKDKLGQQVYDLKTDKHASKLKNRKLVKIIHKQHQTNTKQRKKVGKLKSQQQKKLDNIKSEVNSVHMPSASDFSKYYVIYNGVSMPECGECCSDNASHVNDPLPTFWINDINSFHTGVIHYDHDLIRKIFNKDDLDMFYHAFNKHFNGPHNLFKLLKHNTMTLQQAKDDHLILTSDYTKSYMGHVFQEQAERIREINNSHLNGFAPDSIMDCPSDI